jgi:hypothetical protein
MSIFSEIKLPKKCTETYTYALPTIKKKRAIVITALALVNYLQRYSIETLQYYVYSPAPTTSVMFRSKREKVKRSLVCQSKE